MRFDKKLIIDVVQKKSPSDSHAMSIVQNKVCNDFSDKFQLRYVLEVDENFLSIKINVYE